MGAEDWEQELYPIPLLSLAGVCDIGLDVSRTFIEARLARKEALAMDWQLFSAYEAEVYGSKDCFLDFAAPARALPFSGLAEKLLQSSEEEVCLCLTLPALTPPEVLLQAVVLLEGCRRSIEA